MEEKKSTLNGNEKEEDIEISGDEVQGVLSKQEDMVHSSNQTQSDPSQELDGDCSSPQVSNIDLLLDIPVQVAVEVGRAKIIIRDLLDLSQGSIIKLDRLVGKPMDVLIQDKLIARGEVVQRNGQLGVRLTEIVTPRERIEKLR
jgi:flagellar motor switch protein FliN/FliY